MGPTAIPDKGFRARERLGIRDSGPNGVPLASPRMAALPAPTASAWPTSRVPRAALEPYLEQRVAFLKITRDIRVAGTVAASPQPRLFPPQPSLGPALQGQEGERGEGCHAHPRRQTCPSPHSQGWKPRRPAWWGQPRLCGGAGGWI